MTTNITVDSEGPSDQENLTNFSTWIPTTDGTMLNSTEVVASGVAGTFQSSLWHVNMSHKAFLGVIFVTILLALLSNLSLLIIGFCRRRCQNPMHAILIANLSAANSLICIYLLILGLLSFIPELDADYVLPRHACKMAAVLQSIGYESSLMFLFFISFHEAWSQNKPFVKNVLSPTKTVIISTLIWTFSITLSLVLLHFSSNSGSSLKILTNPTCSYSEAMITMSSGWPLVVALHIGLNAASIIPSCALHIVAIVRKIRNDQLASTLRSKRESFFLYKSSVLTYFALACWVPCLILGKMICAILLTAAPYSV